MAKNGVEYHFLKKEKKRKKKATNQDSVPLPGVKVYPSCVTWLAVTVDWAGFFRIMPCHVIFWLSFMRVLLTLFPFSIFVNVYVYSLICIHSCKTFCCFARTYFFHLR